MRPLNKIFIAMPAGYGTLSGEAWDVVKHYRAGWSFAVMFKNITGRSLDRSLGRARGRHGSAQAGRGQTPLVGPLRIFIKNHENHTNFKMLIRPFKNAVGIKWMPSLESTVSGGVNSSQYPEPDPGSQHSAKNRPWVQKSSLVWYAVQTLS